MRKAKVTIIRTGGSKPTAPPQELHQPRRTPSRQTQATIIARYTKVEPEEGDPPSAGVFDVTLSHPTAGFGGLTGLQVPLYSDSGTPSDSGFCYLCAAESASHWKPLVSAPCTGKAKIQIWTASGGGTITITVTGPTTSSDIVIPANATGTNIVALLATHADLATQMALPDPGVSMGAGSGGLSASIRYNDCEINLPEGVAIVLKTSALTSAGSLTSFAKVGGCCE